MLETIENFKKSMHEKNIGIIGIGVSNIPLVKYLASLGSKVIAFDKRENLLSEQPELKELNVNYVLGEDYLARISDFDLYYIFRSPGVRPFYPELEEAVNNGIVMTSEIEMLLELAPCKVVGITGSDGKTTTTTLVSKFLEEAGYKVWLGGNIGTPIFTKIEEMKQDDIIVLELSSFQLMTCKASPNISVITNVSPNHLDYHRSYDEYIDAKANIFKHQRDGDTVVFNLEDEFTNRFLEEVKNSGIDRSVRYFNLKNINKEEPGVYLDNENIVSNVNGNLEVIDNISNVKLVGMHNIANICAAASAVINLTGIDPIRSVITTFGGVEHRMELVREFNEVKWYNDSIGTSPTRTIAGLKSFGQRIILIAGGYDKNLEYDPIAPYILDKVKTLILMGKTALKIEKSVIDEIAKRDRQNEEYIKPDIITLSSMEECVDYAASIAQSKDIIVLSPASASFDMYKNFEVRGNHFKDLVNKLK